MSEWETVSENHYKNLACRLDRIEVEEGYVYRHMTSIEDQQAANPEVALCFVESKKGE
ncbi:hypothetical protein LCGC14_1220090 [marine sediment metagenome]|uniref:Uncharacterized protein n=1 Tax=marine sediment metagenome TaxID=412755 RepID=A0A0F9LFJ9_9ZZZZ